MDLAGSWPRIKPKIAQHWEKLSAEDLDRIAGEEKVLINLLCQRYGLFKDEARQQITNFLDALEEQEWLFPSRNA